jgi:hypothetical protein
MQFCQSFSVALGSAAIDYRGRIDADTGKLNVSLWHIASFRRVAKFGRYWGKADMPNGFSEGATVKSSKA